MKVRANAKVNLSLDITGKRADGYHTISSVFQSVSLCDYIEVKKAEGIELRCNDISLENNENLCFKAAHSFFQKTNVVPGAWIYIDKHIPKAAGLGGGSTDAAAVLMALNTLYDKPLSEEQMMELALTLGADVPFCLVGGTKLCEGIGEEISELPSLPECCIVIAKRGNKNSTKEMYLALDSAADLRHSDNSKMVLGLNNGDLKEIFSDAYNCFEAVCDREDLNTVKSKAEQLNAVYCGLSGAGPSVITVFDNMKNAVSLVDSLKNVGFWADVFVPTSKGIEIIE